MSPAGGYLMATYLEDAQSKVYQYNYDGTLVREVELPAIGTASGFGAKREATDLYYVLSNFTSPATVYNYDLETGRSFLYKAPQVNFDPDRFVTEQVFYTSKDGTQAVSDTHLDVYKRQGSRSGTYRASSLRKAPP